MAKNHTIIKKSKDEFEVNVTHSRIVDRKELKKQIKTLEDTITRLEESTGLNRLRDELAKKVALLEDINNTK